jgi:hypothetical protein
MAAMATTRPHEPKPSETTLVVCDDDDTLIRLQDYLRRAGVPTKATRQLEVAWTEAESCSTLVLLPDDFDTGVVTDGLYRVLSHWPCPLVVLVTAARQHLEPLLTTVAHPEAIVFTPKPVWGWTILDLVRNREARQT